MTTVPVTASRTELNPWLRFAIRRFTRLVVSVLALLSAAFLMIHLIPGDPVRAALGPVAAQSLVDAQRESLGLNDPLWLQYLHFLQHLFTGNLGTSITTGLPVSDVISDRLPATVVLAVAAFVVAVLIALPLGLAMGVLTRAGRRPKAELTFTSTSVVLAAIPEFLLAVGLVYVFAVQLQWFPVAGRATSRRTCCLFSPWPSDPPPCSPGSAGSSCSRSCRPTTCGRPERSGCRRS